MRRISIKLLTAMLLVTMLISGYNGTTVAAAASDPVIHIVRHVSQDKGTTQAAITIQGIPQDAKGLQFDLMISSNIDALSMTWNSKLLAEYAHYQDKTIAGNKIQRTYYIVTKSMPLESNGLYIGEAVYNNTDVKFETSGEVKWLGDKLQVTSLQQAVLKIETKYDNSDNNSGSGDGSGEEGGDGTGGQESGSDHNTTPPSEDKGEPPITDEDKQQPETDDNKVEITDKPVSFDDITGHWAASSIHYVASKGIMNGTSKDKFEPNVTMTRAMFVQTLFNAEKVLYETHTQGKKSIFKDVITGSWYEDAVNWAVDQGITSGLGNQTFGPQQQITREQMAVMMYQYCKLKGIELPTADKEAFKDQDKISSWAKEAVAAIHGADIMNGLSGNTFEPQAYAKRSEVAAVMERLAKRILLKEA